MVKEIRWTPESLDTFKRIIEYLKNRWSEHEVDKFVLATDRVIEYISIYPYMFRKTNKKNIREALITEHNLLIYKINNDTIDLITFWDTRQNPRKSKK